MKQALRFWLLLFLGMIVPALAQAEDAANAYIQFTGTYIALPQLLGNAVKAARLWIMPVVATVFLLGAFWMVIFAGKEDEVKRGKTMMVKSLIGMSIALMALSILNTVFYVLGI